MAGRRTGDRNAFWNNAPSGANGVSSVVKLSRGADTLALYITVSAGTTVSLEAAHSGDISAEGTLPDALDASSWAPVMYTNIPIQHVFSAAGSIVLLVPDFTPAFVRLRSLAAVTITAGYETTSG
jgi:hypothetical protein